jgi:hypothetical protein
VTAPRLLISSVLRPLQVKVLKNNWGLLRAVERPTDVFFHFSNLVDVPEGELKVRKTEKTRHCTWPGIMI